jgi:cobalt-zinc-cadmium efflux system membrane fusion protein
MIITNVLFNWNIMHIKYSLILLFFLMSGCGKKAVEPAVIGYDSQGGIREIYLETAAVRKLGIKFENAIPGEAANSLYCNGYLTSDPKYRTGVKTAFQGKIKSVFYSKNDYVTKGTVIATIENPEFISLQQEYLEACNQFEFSKEEYARQGDLTVENATSLKKMQIAKRDHQSAELKLNAVKLQLKMIGISADSLRLDKLINVLPVRTPLAGYIDNIAIHSGTYVQKGETIMELMSDTSLFVKIDIPENIFQYVFQGEWVTGSLTFDSLASFKALISSVIGEVDPVTHNATAYARLESKNKYMIPGMSVKVFLSVGKDTTAFISSSALIKEKSSVYIFARHNGNFIKIPVKTGSQSNGQVEVFGLPGQISDSIVVSRVKQLSKLF